MAAQIVNIKSAMTSLPALTGSIALVASIALAGCGDWPLYAAEDDTSAPVLLEASLYANGDAPCSPEDAPRVAISATSPFSVYGTLDGAGWGPLAVDDCTPSFTGDGDSYTQDIDVYTVEVPPGASRLCATLSLVGFDSPSPANSSAIGWDMLPFRVNEGTVQPEHCLTFDPANPDAEECYIGMWGAQIDWGEGGIYTCTAGNALTQIGVPYCGTAWRIDVNGPEATGPETIGVLVGAPAFNVANSVTTPDPTGQAAANISYHLTLSLDCDAGSGDAQ